jgi:hypothetical protein
VCIADADTTDEAEKKTKNSLMGEDIDVVEVAKTERLTTENDGVAIFWEEEIGEI